MEVPLARDAVDAVRFLHYVFASGVCETLGVFLALIWTAGFLPAFLRPSNVTVLLTKPAPRGLLLVGKYIGVLLFVALHASAFVLCTWLALGLKTQVWNPVYLAAAPLLLVQFAAFFGFSVLLATLFRSSIASALGALLCWAVCAGINTAHHAITIAASPGPAAVASSQSQPSESQGATSNPKYNPALATLVNISYWMLPKPIDAGYFVFRELRAGDFVTPPISYDALAKSNAVDLRLSLATSLACAVFLIFAATRQFRETDY
jgi:ABC-type transport system involved in multi-copper enzyme maturation permease subunit